MDMSSKSHSDEPVSCSICLDDVLDQGLRSVVKLRCGHEFHLNCIGSAFNAKGAMECPNCRDVEKGQWVYASGHLPTTAEVDDDNDSDDYYYVDVDDDDNGDDYDYVDVDDNSDWSNEYEQNTSSEPMDSSTLRDYSTASSTTHLVSDGFDYHCDDNVWESVEDWPNDEPNTNIEPMDCIAFSDNLTGSSSTYPASDGFDYHIHTASSTTYSTFRWFELHSSTAGTPTYFDWRQPQQHYRVNGRRQQ